MYLTKEEKEILNGARGQASALAMKTLVKIGEINGAKRLIPIKSVHLVLHAYKSAFNAGVEAAEKIAEMGGRFTVPTTIDPYGMDAEDWMGAKTPPEYAVMQMRLEAAIKKMGVIPVWTCTPYYGFNMPKFGDDIAWSESSAVAFANSVLGARTNRQTAIIDIFSGILGKTPEMGLHLPENRRGEVLINMNIDRELKTWEYPVLGYLIGKRIGSRIGVINGLKGFPSTENMKALYAAAAAAGSVALLHIVGVTPEAKTLEEAMGDNAVKESIDIEVKALQDMRESMCSCKNNKIDFVALGCPHYTINEIIKVHELLNGRSVDSNVNFWIYANREALNLAEKMGIRKGLERSGVIVRAETCMIISPVAPWGFRSMMTDSGKCAYYGPAECGTDIIFASMEECVESAVAGKRVFAD